MRGVCAQLIIRRHTIHPMMTVTFDALNLGTSSRSGSDEMRIKRSGAIVAASEAAMWPPCDSPATITC